MRIPSRKDWGTPVTLDAQWAMDMFLGKTRQEAEAMFASNALNYGEDIQHMPAAAFEYYVPALLDYLLSDRAEGDSDGASSFLRRVLFMLEWRPGTFAGIKDVVIDAAEQVASRQAFYDADESIYGNFLELFAQIRCASERDVGDAPKLSG